MADTAIQTSENTTTQEPKFQRGNLQRVEIAIPKETPVDNNDIDLGNENKEVAEGANATSNANNGAANANANAAPAPTELTEEQLKEFFKSKGIEYDGLDNLKSKLTASQNTSTELTEEQKKVQALAKEKRIVDKFVSGGGTVEQYVALKNVAEMDVAELSKNTAKKELKDSGFDDTEIESIIKERYYQIAIDELEQGDDEEDEAFEKRKNAIKRKKEYGDKLLSTRSLPIKTQAAGILADIQSAIDSEDLQVQREITISAKIDEDFKVLPRKMSIEIGEIGGKTVSPVDYDVSETDIAEVKSMLKDPAQRQQFLFNEDGSLTNTLIQTIVKAKAFDSASKISFLTGQNKAITDFQKTFPATSMQELGVGGSPQKPKDSKPGQPVSYGKVQRVQPQRQ